MAKKKRGPGRPRLSEAKKAKNKQIYKQIQKQRIRRKERLWRKR